MIQTDGYTVRMTAGDYGLPLTISVKECCEECAMAIEDEDVLRFCVCKGDTPVVVREKTYGEVREDGHIFTVSLTGGEAKEMTPGFYHWRLVLLRNGEYRATLINNTVWRVTPGGPPSGGTGLAEELAAARKELEAASKNVEALTARIETLEEELAAANGDVAERKEKIAELQAEILTANGDIETKAARIEALEGELETANGNVTALQAQVTELEGQLATANGNVTTLQAQVTELESELAAANENVSTLQGELTAANDNVTALQAQVDALTPPPDPEQVYKTTRPTDWLKMPTPEDNEIYLLFHIPDGASGLIAFTATCTGSYTVALGTVTDGAFSQVSAVSVESGTAWEAELSADDWGDLTSTGMKQVMIKVSGTDILTWEPSTHPKKTSPSNFTVWNIVEFAGRLPKATGVMAGGETTYTQLRQLVFFALYGPNEIVSAANMFQGCGALRAVTALDTGKVTLTDYMFYGCVSLTAIPVLDTSQVTSMNYMFAGCLGLDTIPVLDTSQTTEMSMMFRESGVKTVPPLDTGKVTGMGGMFYQCAGLRSIPGLNTSSATGMTGLFYECSSLEEIGSLDASHATDAYRMFYQCYRLKKIPEMDLTAAERLTDMLNGCSGLTVIPKLSIAKATAMTNTFNVCLSLEKAELDPEVTGWAGCDISFSNGSMGHGALVKLIQSLPTITEAHTLTLTGNPGASELTEEEIAVATAKNWTVTV